MKEVHYSKIADMPSSPLAGGFTGSTGAGAKDENNRPADLNLSADMIRVFVTNDRAELYGKAPLISCCYSPAAAAIFMLLQTP